MIEGMEGIESPEYTFSPVDDLREIEIARLGAVDAANAARMPSTVPEGWEADNFITPDLPGVQFTIRQFSPLKELGPFDPGDFIPDAHGILSAHVRGSGEAVILRVIGQSNKELTCVDGDGNIYRCVLHILPDTELEVEEP